LADIFISYARPNEPLAKQAGEALRAAGYAVWRDDELPAHRAYSEVIEERIKSAKAVLVMWSNDAVRSQWVRAEADAARELGTLVQVSLDGVLPPMPFNQIQCADLFGWTGDVGWQGWQKVVSSISSLVGSPSPSAEPEPSREPARRVVICVLPFQNMSGDAEQEYFSDGISEDIITDLSKVSALTIIGRNTAFSFKGKPVDMHTLNRDLSTTHVLEGSVRKAGTRVRINAQLTDCLTGHQLLADRYDRDLDDIFAIQDEISKAIVAALRLQLLPKEKKAIERRGTTNPDAYSVYLLARQNWINGNYGDRRRDEMVVRICKQATAIDPGYADAWALMALAQAELRFLHGLEEDGLPAAERALAIDPEVPVALCVKARYMMQDGKLDEAQRQLEEALRLDPDSFEVNKELAYLTFRQDRVKDAIPFFEKAVSLMESDYRCAGMLTTCYQSFGTPEDMQRVAKLAITRAEKAVAQDPTNGTAMALGACALGILGEGDRMREWVARTMLLDPDNTTARYNLTCALARYGDIDAAIDLIGPFFEQAGQMVLSHSDVDPDLDMLRADPRFQAMRAAAGDRLGLAENARPAAAVGPSDASVA
jgi:adenylate cyclase